MEKLTPKVSNALGAVMALVYLKPKQGKYRTEWGAKTEEGLKLTIANLLEDYGVALIEI